MTLPHLFVICGGANPAAHPEAHNLGNYRGTGEIVPFCTCSSLMAKWTYAFGAHLGLSNALWCLPSYFLLAKLREIDAVLIARKLITVTLRCLRRAVSTPTLHILPFMP